MSSSIYDESAVEILRKTGLKVWFVEVVGKRKSYLGGFFQSSFEPPLELKISERIHMFVELEASSGNKNLESKIKQALSIAKAKLYNTSRDGA